MELKVLTDLSWNVYGITAVDFLDHYCHRIDSLYNEPVKFLSKRSDCLELIDSCYVSAKFLKEKPSVLAAVCVFYSARKWYFRDRVTSSPRVRSAAANGSSTNTQPKAQLDLNLLFASPNLTILELEIILIKFSNSTVNEFRRVFKILDDEHHVSSDEEASPQAASGSNLPVLSNKVTPIQVVRCGVEATSGQNGVQAQPQKENIVVPFHHIVPMTSLSAVQPVQQQIQQVQPLQQIQVQPTQVQNVQQPGPSIGNSLLPPTINTFIQNETSSDRRLTDLEVANHGQSISINNLQQPNNFTAVDENSSNAVDSGLNSQNTSPDAEEMNEQLLAQARLNGKLGQSIGVLKSAQVSSQYNKNVTTHRIKNLHDNTCVPNLNQQHTGQTFNLPQVSQSKQHSNLMLPTLVGQPNNNMPTSNNTQNYLDLITNPDNNACNLALNGDNLNLDGALFNGIDFSWS